MTCIHRVVLALLLAGSVIKPSFLGLAQTLKTRPANAAKPAAGAAAASSKMVLPSEDTVNSFLFHMFGYDPTITWKVAEIRPSAIDGLAAVTAVLSNQQGQSLIQLLVAADGKHAINGEILPFGAQPFEDARAKLEKGVNGPERGPAKAEVMIVEFSDMQCPHCQKAAPIIEQLLAQEPEARFVFQNYPLPSHNWAEKAASYVDCVGRLPGSGKAEDAPVWKFIQKTFADQENITEANADEKLKAAATASGANADEIAACAAKAETKTRVQASVALGNSVGVTSTPTLLINGRMMSAGTPVDVLKKIVDFQASLEKNGDGAEKKDK